MQSIADFQDAVQRDLAWRKREIADLRAAAAAAEETSSHVFRSGQVLLCAHWEGFLKRASNIYVNHVFSQQLRLKELKPHLVAIAYFKDVMNAALAKYPGSQDHHVQLASKIIAAVDQPIAAASWSADTEGNPGSDVLERILLSIGVDTQLGFDGATWATTKVFINEQLVRDRHHIAHGDGLRLAKENFLERAGRLLDLLDTLSDRIVEAAERQAYKAA